MTAEAMADRSVRICEYAYLRASALREASMASAVDRAECSVSGLGVASLAACHFASRVPTTASQCRVLGKGPDRSVPYLQSMPRMGKSCRTASR